MPRSCVSDRQWSTMSRSQRSKGERMPPSDSSGTGDTPERQDERLIETTIGNLLTMIPQVMEKVAKRNRLTNAQSEDLAQEVTLYVLQQMAKNPELLKRITNVPAYINAVAQRRFIDVFRKERRRRIAEFDVNEAPSPAKDSSEFADVDLESALASIDERHARLLKLVIAGQSRDQIARQLGVSTTLVKARLSRAREVLRNAILGSVERQRAVPLFVDIPEPEVGPLPIDLYLDPGDASENDSRAVLRALSDLHRASGGLGLEFRIEGTFVRASSGVPA